MHALTVIILWNGQNNEIIAHRAAKSGSQTPASVFSPKNCPEIPLWFGLLLSTHSLYSQRSLIPLPPFFSLHPPSHSEKLLPTILHLSPLTCLLSPSPSPSSSFSFLCSHTSHKTLPLQLCLSLLNLVRSLYSYPLPPPPSKSVSARNLMRPVCYDVAPTHTQRKCVCVCVQILYIHNSISLACLLFTG